MNLLTTLFDPNAAISAALDGYDFSTLHFVASLLGAMMAVYVMQLWSTGALTVEHDCTIAQGMRRAALTILALALLWSMAYHSTKGWSPWPSDILAILAVDCLLASVIVVAIRTKYARRSA